jgi:hypothetical protein
MMSAGNVMAPAYLTLIELGYVVTKKGDLWRAKNGNIIVNGYSPIELLGLIEIRKIRGKDWFASDNEIVDFLNLFMK